MKLNLNIRIAIGLLRARLKQSVVAAVGVTFGIAMFITLIGFMSGLNGLLDGLILNRTPHVRLYNDIEVSEMQPSQLYVPYKEDMHVIRSVKPRDRGIGIYDAQKILQTLRRDPRVYGVSAKITSQIFFRTGTHQIAGVINAVEAQEEDRLFSFSDNVVKGSFTDLDKISNSVFLGKGLAEKMLAEIGDIIQVTSPAGNTFSLRVIGIFQIGLADFDNVQSYVSLQTAQQIEGRSAGFITDLQIKLYDMNIAPDVAKEYAKAFGTEAADIQTANAQFETGSSVRTIISYAVGITLLIVAGFGIYNILNMLIYEKMDSIAILKATGFSGSDVKKIFLSLSMIIGIAGGIVGLLLGFLLSLVVDNIPFNTAALPSITTYPVDYSLVYYIIAIIFALITTYASGYFPARKASVIDPVIIIRGK